MFSWREVDQFVGVNHQPTGLTRRRAGFFLSALALVNLTGCVGYVDGSRPAHVYVAPPPVVIADDYVYYPGYHVYYNNYRHQYYYQENRAWVSRPAPRGVSVDVLLASPSVRMDFHDSPSRHHAAVVRQYPRTWTAPSSRPGPTGPNGRDQRR